MKQRTYIAIYLKLFYAFVVCCERELDSMDTNFVVADVIRTNKTGFLAVTLSLKKYGILDEDDFLKLINIVKEANASGLNTESCKWQ